MKLFEQISKREDLAGVPFDRKGAARAPPALPRRAHLERPSRAAPPPLRAHREHERARSSWELPAVRRR